MKFDCGRTKAESRAAARDYWLQWNRWFAWYPVRVGAHDCRWLEYVERKAGGVVESTFPSLYPYLFQPYDFTYRATNDNNPEARRAA